MKANDAIKVMRDMVNALNSENYKKVEACFTDDLEYDDVPMGKVYHGIKEFMDYVKKIHFRNPDHKWELTSVFSDGHMIASESVSSGTFTRSDDPAMPADGKYGSVRCASITKLRDGKIFTNADYYDLFAIIQQHSPPKP